MVAAPSCLARAGPIEEDPGERTFGQQMTDESIETKAKVNINAADEGYDAAHLSVVSFNGFVLLVGQSHPRNSNPSHRRRAEVEDVRRIYNELEVGEAIGAGARTNDTWITTQVKSKLLRVRHARRRVKVVTENSVVYLMGLLTEAEAARVSLEAAEVSGAERVVQLFELIPAPPI